MPLTLVLRNLMQAVNQANNPDLRTGDLPPVDRIIDEGVSKHIRSQIPDFVHAEGEGFLVFLEAYYEFLEKKQNAYAKTHTLYELSDLDTTLDEFLTYFNDKFIANFPRELAVNQVTGDKVNQKTLMKNIKDFYRAKGTEKSYKLLFRILYDSDLALYYPKKDMLRASDGKWTLPKSIKVTTDNTDANLRNFENRIIQQFAANGQVQATATVDAVNLYRQDPYDVCELFLKNITGKFLPDLEIECLISGVKYRERVYSHVVGIQILEGGVGFKVGDRFELNDVMRTKDVGSAGVGGVFKVKNIGINGEIKEIEILDSGVNYSPAPEELSTNKEPSKSKRKIFKKQFDDGEFAGKNYLTQFGTDKKYFDAGERSRRRGTNDNLVSYSNFAPSRDKGKEKPGSNFDFELIFGALHTYYGFYKGNDGKLSSNKYIQDSYFYQDFSYVLKSSESIKKYKSIIKRVIHPSGHEVFGRISLSNDVTKPMTHHSMFQSFEVPIIGHYTPYTFKTTENLRNNTASTDLYPHGFNPGSTGGATAAAHIFGLCGGRLELTKPRNVSGAAIGFTTGSFVVGQTLHNGMTASGGTGTVAAWYLHRATTKGGSASSGVLFLSGVTGNFPLGSTVANGNGTNGELGTGESSQPIQPGNGTIFNEAGSTLPHFTNDLPLGTGGTDEVYGGSAAAQGYNYNCWVIYHHPNSRGWNKIPAGISFGAVGLRWFFHMPFGLNFHSDPDVSTWLTTTGSTAGHPYYGSSTGDGSAGQLGQYGSFGGVSTGTPNLGLTC